MTNTSDIRWQQRFSNFDRAIVLLRIAAEKNEETELSPLEQEGFIQRFEYTYELAWKTLKDYLEYSGNINWEEITARSVFKEAFAAKIIQTQDVFVDMMLTRNVLSHTYDFEVFKDSIEKICKFYLPALEFLHVFFIEKITNE